MNTVQKTLSGIKLIMLIGLCLYTGLSALFFVYLQIRFFDPIYFQKIAVRILGVGLILGWNLSLSVKHLRHHTTVSHLTAFLCSAAGCLLFLRTAINVDNTVSWFFAYYCIVILLISTYELISTKG